MITSDQIHEKEFSYKMRGYNDAEVDAYLDQLAAFIDNLTKENKELRERLKSTADQLTYMKNLETTLRDTLITAQRSAEETTRNASLRAEEAALTGESVPVSKSADALTADGEIGLGDRSNMLYLGSSIVYGRGRAVVTETGMQTQMGHIADALTQTKENKTPLQLRLSQLSRILTWLVLGICAIVFAVGVLRAGTISGRVVLDTFLIAVSLAVAAIPEGLAAVVTIVLSIGVTNMSRRSAVIRWLTAVETLGCAQIICTDKTGTLTQNRMTVTASAGSDERLLATAMALCADAVHDPDTDTVTGEPTEAALVRWAVTLGLPPSALRVQLPRVAEMKGIVFTDHAANLPQSRRLLCTVLFCGLPRGGRRFAQVLPFQIRQNAL
mgnify:CR=1 FL=1